MGQHHEAQFREFVEARWQTLLRTAILLTGDQGRAEDLVQQTLVIVHRKWRTIGPGNATAYARAVLANESASWWRRRRYAEVSLSTPAGESAAQVHADPAAPDCRASQAGPPRRSLRSHSTPRP